MEIAQMIIELEIALDGANLTWAHGVLLGITCISLIAVTFSKWLKHKGGPHPLRAVSMVKMDVPFSVAMDDDGKGVTVRSSVVRKVEIYWDFNIRKFYPTLIRNWVLDEPVLRQSMWASYKYDDAEQVEKTFGLYEEQVVRHSVPRKSYPVAVIVRNLKRNVKFREILGLITVIELGDTTKSAPTARIVGRYLKLGNGQIAPLQRFFASGLCHDNNTDVCVVCRESPVTRVALPCRHACFCAPCFERVEKCSMCTASIDTYFCIEPAVDDVD